MKFNLKTILASILIFAQVNPTFAAGRIQNEDVKSLSDITTAGGTKAQLINDTKIYVTANSINDQLSNAITNGLIGSSGGSKNYLSAYVASLSGGTANSGNGDFEQNATTGWSLFNTTLTSGVPTGSITAGAASLTTFATTSTNPLEKKYSLNVASTGATTAGQGFISNAFYIDSADQAKALTITANYSVASGLANMNFSGSSSNTWAVYAYDVTNSLWIQPAGVYNFVQGTGVGNLTATFQTSSNGTQYRLAIININATAGAMSMLFDKFTTGPTSSLIAPVMSDWVSFTPTGSWTTNTTYTGKYRRVGDTVEVQWGLNLSGAPTTASLILNLPSGLSVDTTKLAIGGTPSSSAAVLGQGGIIHSGTIYTLQSYVATTSSIGIVYQSAISGLQASVSQAAPVTFASGDSITFNWTGPITGWSSNALSSSDTDSRVIQMRAANQPTTVSGSITSGTAITSFGTPQEDTAGAYNSSTGVYTIPVSGRYSLSVFAKMVASTTFVAGDQGDFTVTKNGSVNVGTISTFAATGTVALTPSGTVTFNAIAGDAITIVASSTSNFSSYTAGTGFNTLSINRLSGPAVVQATESVSAKYHNTTGQSIVNSTDTVVQFNSKLWDTHNAVTTGASWTFKAPLPGKYSIKSFGLFGNVAWAGSSRVYGFLNVNSSTPSDGACAFTSINAAVTQEISYSCINTMQLNTGDTIQLHLIQSSGNTQTFNSSGIDDWIEIDRIGN